MVYRIKSAIAEELKAIYPNTKIYPETIKQGLKLPCFFINRVRNRKHNALDSFRQKQIEIDVVYLPAADEIYEVETALLDIDVINRKGLLFRLQDKETFEQDKDLHFRFRVKLRELVLTNDELMQNAELREELKAYE